MIREILRRNALYNKGKHVKLKYSIRKDGNYTLQITEQSHRNSSFGCNGVNNRLSNAILYNHRFCSSENHKLSSDGMPENGGYDLLFMRGSEPHSDNNKIVFSKERIIRSLRSAAEYNTFFNQPMSQ